MAGTDNYEFAKSELVQGLDKYSPYTQKQWNYVNDIKISVCVSKRYASDL